MRASARSRLLDVLYLVWGLTAGMNTVTVGPIRVSHAATLAIIVVLWFRVLLSRSRLGLMRNSYMVASVLLLVGGTLGTLATADEGIRIAGGGTAVFGGMTLTVLIMAMGQKLGARVVLAAHGLVIAAVLNGLATVASPMTRDGRSVGLMRHPNHTGLVIALGMVLYLVIRPQGERRWHDLVPWRWIDAAVVIVCVAGLLRTGSRSAALIALLGFAFILAQVAKRRLQGVLVALAGLMVFAALAPTLAATSAGERLLGGGSATASDAARVERLGEALDIALDSPILGSGFSYVSSAHSVPLQLWQTAGLLGLVALVLIVATMFRSIRRAGSNLGADAARAILLMILVNWLIQNTIFSQYVWIAITASASSVWREPIGRSIHAVAPRRRAAVTGPRRDQDLRPRVDRSSSATAG